MKKLLLTASAILLYAGAVLAQGKTNIDAEKSKIAILPFDAVKIAEQYGARQSWSWQPGNVTWQAQPESPFADAAALVAFAEAATQRTVDAFFKTGRFTVIDRTAMEKIMKEQDFQLSDNVDPNSVAQIGALLGAQYIVNGQIQQVSTNPYYDPKDKSKLLGYSGTVELQITLIEVGTGQVTGSKRVKGSTEVEGTKILGMALLDAYESTPSKAAYKGLDECSKDLKNWLRDAFPVEGEIFEIVKQSKKEGATRVNITCGKDIGVKKGDRFKVYTESEMEVAGKMRKKTTDVGALEVKSVGEDGWSSTCDVEKGGKAIAEKIAAGVKLKVVSVKK